MEFAHLDFVKLLLSRESTSFSIASFISSHRSLFCHIQLSSLCMDRRAPRNDAWQTKSGSKSPVHLTALLLGTSLVTLMVKHLPTMQETQVQSLGQEGLLEKEMATHSSIVAWKIPWMEEPGRL